LTSPVIGIGQLESTGRSRTLGFRFYNSWFAATERFQLGHMEVDPLNFNFVENLHHLPGSPIAGGELSLSSEAPRLGPQREIPH